jgi:hypothetical protein
MEQPLYPSLYQINTRVWLTEISGQLGRKAILDDIPDAELDHLASLGFDWLWFLSVWTTGEKGRSISRTVPEWRRDYEKTLSDLKEEDIAGSGFAIADYRVHPDLGGDEALKRLRARLQKRGMKLMLDFVPNHMGPDHPWVEEHPEFFINGNETDLEQNPQNYTRVKLKQGDMVFAYGRDPYFSGWPDTVQLDYSNPVAAEAMKQELMRIASQCDGVRCDMAMLILHDVFERTWGRKAHLFWSDTIKAVHAQSPDFCFMAEVYWDMEWELQQLGFDYAYDKRLYDRLHEGHAKPVREHFYAGLDYQNKLARFLENHDESRAALAFGKEKHEAAAIIAYLSPGLRFFHQGQFEGRLKRISPHLVRGPKETTDEELQLFYSNLLSIIKKPVFRNGTWKLIPCEQAWEGNHTQDSYLAFIWEGTDGQRVLVVVNYAAYQGQCYVRLPFTDLADKKLSLTDLMGGAFYDRHGSELISGGLYLDMPAWGYHVFKIAKD